MNLLEAVSKINIKLNIDLFKDNGYTNKIGRLSRITKKWTIIGELQNAREDLSVVFYENHFLVTGGYAGLDVSLPTERCILADDQVTCQTQTPSLYNFWSLETLIVSFDFCQ